jgi:hypothetical protein
MTNEQETNMITAHKAGRAYWCNNRPEATSGLETVARSCGWSDAELLAAWMAGYYGERARMLAKRQECARATAHKMRHVIRELPSIAYVAALRLLEHWCDDVERNEEGSYVLETGSANGQ